MRKEIPSQNASKNFRSYLEINGDYSFQISIGTIQNCEAGLEKN